MSHDQTNHASGGAAVAEHPQVSVTRVVRDAVTPPPPPQPAPVFLVTDMLVRDYFGDTGSIPTNGYISNSPDIIPYGTGTLDVAEAIRTYKGPDIGQPVVVPGTNNLYVRAINQYPGGAESATVALYCCTPSLFMLPDQWQKNQLKTADGSSNVSFVNRAGSKVFKQNDICLTEEAFYLTSLDRSQHYCLIAVVNTPHTPVPIPSSFPSTAEFIQWVANSPAVAWRNLTLVPNTVTQLLQTMVFGNADSTGGMFHFTLQGRNLPVGTTVTVQCTDQACTFTETVTIQQPEADGLQYAGFDQYVPGEFLSAVTVTATPPAGQSFATGSSLFAMYWQYPPMQMTDLHRKVGRFAALARTAPDGTNQVSSHFVLPVGRCTLEIVDPG